jgi:hypothetical protein
VNSPYAPPKAAPLPALAGLSSIRVEGWDGRIDARELVDAVYTRRMDPMTKISFDDGRTWIAAGPPATRLHAKLFGQDGIAAVVPVGVEPWCLAAGYVALLWPIFFGNIGTAFAFAAASAEGGSIPGRLLTILAGLVFCVGPVLATALLGLKKTRSDPTWRGRGRAIFALVMTVLFSLPSFGALVLMMTHA